MNKLLVREIEKRSAVCEFCSSDQNITPVLIEGMIDSESASYALVCTTCDHQINKKEEINMNHWRCLNECMWSDVPAVKVASYRMLKALKQPWCNDLLDMLYIEEDLLNIAKSTEVIDTHFDANGVVLYKGDSVVLIKDLSVKGSSLVAKRGTAIRNISLSHNQPSHIVGKVEGQTIFIKTEFVKK